MKKISTDALDQLFLNARTHSHWLDRSIPDEVLRDLYDLMKWGPTSANTSPARVVFIKSQEARSRLLACMDPGNVEKTRTAPVTVIIAEDMRFYDQLPKLFPHADARSWFAGNAALVEKTAFRNSSLQGAYFMIAARALGLDCGPMSGFDAAKVASEFLKGTDWRANFICNLGYGDAAKLHPRNPRLDFEEACRIV